MEFLYKLYSNNYFGIGLFIVITVLAFAFLIILFFGKKDEKERMAEKKELENYKKEKTTEQEIVNSNNLESIVLEQESPSMNEIDVSKLDTIPKDPFEQPLKEEESLNELDNEYSVNKEKVEEEYNFQEQIEPIETFQETPREELDPFVTSNIVLNTDYIEEPIMENSVEANEEMDLTSNIYSLDSIINEESNSIPENETFEDVLNKYDDREETELVNTSDYQQNASNNSGDGKDSTEWKVFNSSNESSKKMASPFSSVYLTKEQAEEKQEKMETENSYQQPSKPSFEMPKRVDLPKRSENASTINDNIISSLREEKNENILDQIEEDSYIIKK